MERGLLGARAGSYIVGIAVTVAAIAVLTHLVLLLSEVPALIAAAAIVRSAAAFVAFVIVFASVFIQPSNRRQRLLAVVFSLAYLVFFAAEATTVDLAYEGYFVPFFAESTPNLHAWALLALLVCLALALRIDEMPRARAVRLMVDSTAIASLFVSMFFRLEMTLGVVHPAQAALPAVLRQSAQGAAAVLVLLAAGALVSLTGWTRMKPWERASLMSVALLALGVFVRQMLAFSPVAGAHVRSIPAEIAASTVLLLGYLVVIVAVPLRLSAADEGRVTTQAAPVRVSPLPGLVMTTFVLISVAYLGWGTLMGSTGNPVTDQVYLFVLVLGAICIALRTALVAVETTQLSLRSYKDQVTGCGNVHAMRERLRDLAAAAHRLDRPFSLAIMSLDGFSEAVDKGGKERGDALLTQAAKTALVHSRVQGVYRIEADEFAVMLDATGSVDTQATAERLAAALTSSTGLPVSMGLASCPADASTAEQLLRNARSAHAWAQGNSTGSVVFFDSRIAVAIGCADAFEQLGEAEVQRARALQSATDAIGLRSAAHSRGVAALCCLVAAELGFDAERIEMLRIAASLHDVGKVACLDETGRDGSRESLEHPVYGETLAAAAGLLGVAGWIRHHHERWDGAGYPDGLTAAQIPMESRIIALADSYDAMRSGVRHGPPMSRAAALLEIDQGMGTAFDPDLAEVFIRVVGTTAALGWSDEWPAA